MHLVPAALAAGDAEPGGFEPRVLEGTVGSGTVDWHLALLLVLSGVGSLVVFALAASAFRRRRSLPYLLITAALGALVLRPIVGTGTVLGYVPMDAHHTIEHLLDVVIAGLLIAAVVTVGSLEGRRGSVGSDFERRADGGESDE